MRVKQLMESFQKEQKRWEKQVLKEEVDFTELVIDPAPFQLVEHTSLMKVRSWPLLGGELSSLLKVRSCPLPGGELSSLQKVRSCPLPGGELSSLLKVRSCPLPGGELSSLLKVRSCPLPGGELSSLLKGDLVLSQVVNSLLS